MASQNLNEMAGRAGLDSEVARMIGASAVARTAELVGQTERLPDGKVDWVAVRALAQDSWETSS